jgi:hypothetical protein
MLASDIGPLTELTANGSLDVAVRFAAAQQLALMVGDKPLPEALEDKVCAYVCMRVCAYVEHASMSCFSKHPSQVTT